MTIFVANSNVLELNGLKSALDGTYINDADVTVIICDNNGLQVAGLTWPFSMTYVEGSNGDYRAVLPATLALKADTDHRAALHVNAGAGRIGHWQKSFKPTARG